MADALLTHPSLLARLDDPKDRLAWQQFVDLYGSLVYGFARQRGLQDADAADLTQEVLLAIAQTAGHWRYDPKRGSFRGWLYGITRNEISQFLHSRQSQPLGSGDTTMHQRLAEEPEPESEAIWEREYQQHLFRLAAAQIQKNFSATTWKAFWQTAVEGAAGAVVAAELGISVGAVYVARSRVLARLTEVIQQMRME
jgi:RNA polymerase sigma-70 factor (ECF subfamily)